MIFGSFLAYFLYAWHFQTNLQVRTVILTKQELQQARFWTPSCIFHFPPKYQKIQKSHWLLSSCASWMKKKQDFSRVSRMSTSPKSCLILTINRIRNHIQSNITTHIQNSIMLRNCTNSYWKHIKIMNMIMLIMWDPIKTHEWFLDDPQIIPLLPSSNFQMTPKITTRWPNTWLPDDPRWPHVNPDDPTMIPIWFPRWPSSPCHGTSRIHSGSGSITWAQNLLRVG